MIPKPNFTQIPNIILDNMEKFSNAEFKILCFICRKTFGWHKDKDRIAYSQIMEGTGVGRNTIPRTVGMLMEKNLLIRSGNPKSGYTYELQISELSPSWGQAIPTMVIEKTESIPTMGTTKETINKLSKEKGDESPHSDDDKLKERIKKLSDIPYYISKENNTLPIGKHKMDDYINSNKSCAKIIFDRYKLEEVNEVIRWVRANDYWSVNFKHLTQWATIFGQWKSENIKRYSYA